MVSAETRTTADANMVFMMEAPPSGPRISFSADLSSSDSEGDYICINPKKLLPGKQEQDKSSPKAGDFKFLSNTQTMLTADELFSEGKFLPFRHVKHSEKLQSVTSKTKAIEEEKEEDRKVVREEENVNKSNRGGSWFLDDDPSPRPPKCTVLWKELLRLKKQRTNTKASSLSPSSSSSSTSSSSSSIGDAVKKDEREKEGKRGKKGLERTRSLTMRIRPMIHVPVCTSPSKPPLFPLRLHKNRVERRT
ncbi:Uncharacterized protein Rs2_11855 [Raphanus sativus]|uniref:Uncharacterized protein LOC108846573 n=1 Tax=Raphanus sativus TaxID=3726 RepID=A0A6J0MUN1_RAPSA|nr:uncharacterized protein LOC108846573 [Raphanus sativus]XP_056861131.1 uncharacterized protein LOC130509321 [Raphanus sativus]KAJ4869315.1 Uncharacterized protein Rs2_49138 [Raphanus sativus]KAJ4908197.1 Uncharacterized protein Rs2_11855 [Raphanus sativus]